nr:hypothetical protein [Candidatus Njordarchaeota archaeon]
MLAPRGHFFFDIVIFNPPYLRTEEPEQGRGWLERSWAGGSNGRAVLDRFVDRLPVHLKMGGRLFILHPSYGVRTTIRKLKEMGMGVSVVASKKLFFEKLLLLVARFDKASRSM